MHVRRHTSTSLHYTAGAGRARGACAVPTRRIRQRVPLPRHNRLGCPVIPRAAPGPRLGLRIFLRRGLLLYASGGTAETTPSMLSAYPWITVATQG